MWLGKGAIGTYLYRTKPTWNNVYKEWDGARCMRLYRGFPSIKHGECVKVKLTLDKGE